MDVGRTNPATDEWRTFHLITRFLRGGAEKTTLNTFGALKEAEQSYDIRLGVGASYDAEQLMSVSQLGIETVVFKSIRHYNPVTAPIAVLAVARYLWTEDIDIVHTHSTEAGIIGRFAARLAGVPIVIHEIHGDPITTDRNSFLNATILRLEQITATFSTTLIVNSNRIKETYLERGIGTPDQYKTIYDGTNIETYSNAPSIHSEDVPILLFAGRLTSGKGLFDLLDAIETLIEYSDFKLLIAGDGDLKAEMSNRIRNMGLGEYVELLGYRDDIPSLMTTADALVLPSYREGTPRVIVESLAAGTPVVATEIAGIPELIDDGKTGYLIEPGNVDMLVEKLHRLLANKELRTSMGVRAEQSVDKFDITKSKTAYRELYDEVTTKCV